MKSDLKKEKSKQTFFHEPDAYKATSNVVLDAGFPTTSSNFCRQIKQKKVVIRELKGEEEERTMMINLTGITRYLSVRNGFNVSGR